MPNFFSGLPDEILLEIIENLENPEDIVNLSATNKRLNRVSNDFSVWKRLYKNLFPHRYDDHIRHDDLRGLFIDCYTSEYRNLTAKQKKLFNAVKKGNLTKVKELVDNNETILHDLKKNLLIDGTGKSVADWARILEHQDILNYLCSLDTNYTNMLDEYGSLNHGVLELGMDDLASINYQLALMVKYNQTAHISDYFDCKLSHLFPNLQGGSLSERLINALVHQENGILLLKDLSLLKHEIADDFSNELNQSYTANDLLSVMLKAFSCLVPATSCSNQPIEEFFRVIDEAITAGYLSNEDAQMGSLELMTTLHSIPSKTLEDFYRRQPDYFTDYNYAYMKMFIEHAYKLEDFQLLTHLDQLFNNDEFVQAQPDIAESGRKLITQFGYRDEEISEADLPTDRCRQFRDQTISYSNLAPDDAEQPAGPST